MILRPREAKPWKLSESSLLYIKRSEQWKKEKEERRPIEDKISEIFPSPFWGKSTI
jgi:hypothetical protein